MVAKALTGKHAAKRREKHHRRYKRRRGDKVVGVLPVGVVVHHRAPSDDDTQDLARDHPPGDST